MATQKKEQETETKEPVKKKTTTKKTGVAEAKKKTTTKKATSPVKKETTQVKEETKEIIKTSTKPKSVAKTATKKKTTTKKTEQKEPVKKTTTKKKSGESRVEKLIAEQAEKIENVEVEEIQIEKEEKKTEKIDTKAVEKEIQKNKKIPAEEMKKINKAVFQNILIAVLVLVYFIFINLGFANIEQSIFLKDLQVFSLGALVLAIVVFETAYRKDSGKIAIFGIEALIVAAVSLTLIYVDVVYNDKLAVLVTFISLAFGVYYAVKSLIIYIKMKKDARKKLSDIKEIIKK